MGSELDEGTLVTGNCLGKDPLDGGSRLAFEGELESLSVDDRQECDLDFGFALDTESVLFDIAG